MSIWHVGAGRKFLCGTGTKGLSREIDRGGA